jgi:hypothetical protein
MKHKSSVLLCEMDDGTINIYVNGVAVFIDNKPTHTPIDKIANCHHNKESVCIILAESNRMLLNECY